jgi:Ca2+-binding RTX toxin-like protein
VAGVAMLALSRRPDLTAVDLKAILGGNYANGNPRGADKLPAFEAEVVTRGRINARKVLDYIDTTFGGFTRVVIGDQSGSSSADSILIRPKEGDANTVEILRNGDRVTTTDNANSRRIGIFALGANDTVTVADGVNARLYISGGAGADSLQGGNYLDTIYAGTGNDTVSGGGSADLIQGQGGNDRLNGDGLFGSSGNDTIFGDAHDDTIYGNGGDDSITGGSGSDYLYGDAGNDTIRANDLITDRYNGGGGTNVLDIDSGDILTSIFV